MRRISGSIFKQERDHLAFLDTFLGIRRLQTLHCKLQTLEQYKKNTVACGAFLYRQ